MRINPLSAHIDAGTKAGRARRLHDESLARFMTNWHRRAARLEQEDYRREAEEAFTSAYIAEARVATRPLADRLNDLADHYYRWASVEDVQAVQRVIDALREASRELRAEAVTNPKVDPR